MGREEGRVSTGGKMDEVIKGQSTDDVRRSKSLGFLMT